jgi:ATP-dependent Clp protease ATP-binding subunit ClpA
VWQRFNDEARKAVFLAQEAAQRFGEGHVTTEHVLLGLIKDDCAATAVLALLEVGTERVRQEVERQLPRGEPRLDEDLLLTPRAKRVIDLAIMESRLLEDNYIGTGHLLLGLVREGDGLAGRVLAKLGIDLTSARAAVLALRQEDIPEKTPKRDKEKLKKAMEVLKQKVARFEERSPLDFLFGACIQEHLMLNLIAGGGLAAKIIEAQVEDIGQLQCTLWQEIERYSQHGPRRRYPEIVAQTLEDAQTEAASSPVEPQHILLALLNAKWSGLRFGFILRDAGLSLERSRDLSRTLS